MAIVKGETSTKAKTAFKINLINEEITETGVINLLVDAINKDPKQTIAVLKNLNK